MNTLNREHAQLKDDPKPIRFVQFGAGNFMRGFVDWMIQQMNEKADFFAGVAVVKPTEKGDYRLLKKQDGLYHVNLRGLVEEEEQNLIGLVDCIEKIVNPYKDFNAFVALAKLPRLKYVISNTTESGIKFSFEDFLEEGMIPFEFPGKLTLLLYERYKFYEGDPNKGLIILPCEVIENNGAMLQDCVMQYIQSWNLPYEFEEWMEESVVFCNTLVDRSVIGYPHKDAAAINEALEIKDDLLVTAELYHKWIIEGPEEIRNQIPFEEADLNVKWTDDLSIHSQVKLKLLDGVKTAMVGIGLLAGAKSVEDVATDTLLSAFLKRMVEKELIPSIEVEPKGLFEESKSYFERFRNPLIRQVLFGIGINSIDKFKARLLPALKDYYFEHEVVPPFISFALAALIRFYKGEIFGKDIHLTDNPVYLKVFATEWNIKDLSIETLNVMIENILTNETVWGEDLTEFKGLVPYVANILQVIENYGIEYALHDVLRK